MQEDTKVIPIKQDEYISHMITVASEVRIKLAKNEEVDPYQVVHDFVEPDKNNSELERVLSETGLMTRAEFKKAVQKKKKNQKIEDELGFVPKNVGDYINQFVARNDIKVLLGGEITRNWKVTLDGNLITEDDLVDPEVAAYYHMRAEHPFNTEDMKLELRVIRDTIGLDYADNQISDAVTDWYQRGRKNRRFDLFDHIKYKKGVATGPIGQETWKTMEKACFDTTRTSPGFAIAVIKKFMWDVKRKGNNHPVTNHLMPVLTGKQGGGKSTFVERMTKPIKDAVMHTTFEAISDERNIDLWSTPILFMDEMSGAKKADKDTVKHAITASHLTRRPMRTNSSILVRQLTTFIGCSNEGLGEIIRDNTGIRRFAELEFSQTPDWDTMDRIDWLMLWQSVDELGTDPSIGIFTVLKQQQEENRNMCQVETWAREVRSQHNSWQKSSVLHSHFSEWEKVNFPGYNTSVAQFGRRMGNLIKQQGTEFGWSHQLKSGFAWLRTI